MKSKKEPANLNSLSSDKLELFKYLLDEEGVSLSESREITPRGGDDDLPLSSSQERLWILEQLVPGTPTYHIPEGLYLKGSLDLDALRRSLDETVRRHEVLRTSFIVKDGRPFQSVKPAERVDLEVIDLRDLPEADRKGHSVQIANQQIQRPFDLVNGPLLRVGLLRLQEDEHMLVIVMHHMISDGLSMELFVREVVLLYEAFSAGRPSPLRDLEVQYADYAIWERRWLESPALQIQYEYWKRQLANLQVLELPTDRPRPAVQSFRGAMRLLELPPELSSSLDEMSLREGTTLFMTMMAAYAALLHRCSGQQDIAIGTPVADRSQLNIEGMIGLFVNTLVLRVDLSGDPTYRELLGRVKRVTIDAFEHQDLPFDKLVEALQVKRDLSRGALRQVVFAMQKLVNDPVSLPGLTIIPMVEEIKIGVARLDMSLFVWESRGLIKGALEYNTDLFNTDTVERFISHFHLLLADMAEDPTRRIRVLPPLIEDRGRQQYPSEPATTVADQGLQEIEPPPARQSNLSESESLFWFSKKLQPDVRLYFDYVTAAFTIHGLIDRSHFGRAFQKLVDHSDALRSTIHEVDRIPLRRVHEKLDYELDYQDFSDCPDPSAACRGWVGRRSSLEFDFAKQLFDSALLKLAEDRFVWFVSINHIVSDLWSLSVMARRVSEYYKLSLEGRLDSARPMTPYQDYVDYEQAFRLSDQYREAEAYWARKIADSPTLSPFYRTDSSKQTTAVERVSRNIGRERTRVIKEMANRQGLFSPAVIFATTLFVYQYRITGESHLRIGSPFANRPEALRDTIGLFINICPLDVVIDADDTFMSLAWKVQREIIQAVRNRSYPVRNPVGGRIYNIYFNYMNASFADLCGMPVEFELIHSGHSNETLTLLVQDFSASDSFVLGFEFNRYAFNEQQREASVNHFSNLLDAFIKEQERPLSGVGMLSGRERREILFGLNDTSRGYRRSVCLHGLIEEQVGRDPQADALVYEDRRLSYAELNSRANQLARYLRSRGVGPDVPVGICMLRSVEMVVGLLGILKSGGAYVPLDPTYPAERLGYMLEDAQMTVLLTQREVMDLPAGKGVEVIYLDEAWGEVAAESNDNLPIEVGEDNIAYVIFTSGSTGRPKGVMIPHRGICNRLFWMQEAYHLTRDDRVLQKTPFSFDVSVWEFFWPLISGATLVVARPGGHQDKAYLMKEIDRHKITTLHFVPSMLQVFLEKDDVEGCESLRRVICSGEALSYELQQQFFDKLDAELHNLYGPTEASVDVTYWECKRVGELRVVPIGRPIANTQIHLLDKQLHPVPFGISGELHIGGINLARGYVNRPDLTAEKFIPNPFSAEPGARLYKTGDLGRYLPDGNIEYLGRSDHQVKIRGFRIELGEVERTLAQHPAIRDVVLTAREDRPGDKRLVAYYVAGQDGGASPAELRSFLKDRLPEYMVPTAFVEMDAFPLTPNGKVNLKALPAPEQAHLGSKKAFVAPRSPLEGVLAHLWAEVLGVERVGVYDDFFELGGQSLLATRVIYKLKQILSADIPLRSVFESPTVAGLAEVIKETQSDGLDALDRSAKQYLQRLRNDDAPGADAQTIFPRARDSEWFPLSFAQQRLWFYDQLEPGSYRYNIPEAVRITGPLDISALEESLNEVVRRHETWRTRFGLIDGEPVQTIAPSFAVRMPVIDLGEIPHVIKESYARALAVEDGKKPFDLTTLPLFRPLIIKLDEGDHVFLLTNHHIISDRWSRNLIIQELISFYEAFSEGEAPAAPEPPIQYLDFALWQRDWLQGEVLESQLDYWKRQLEGPLPVLNLPTDRPRPPVQTYRGGTRTFGLPRSLSDEVKALYFRENATLFMATMAAFSAMLYRYTGQTDLIVGVPIANRNKPEIEKVIGFFVNMLALRTRLSAGMSFRELLREVRGLTLDAYAHQDLPFDKLVEETQPGRDLSSNPLFQVCFTVQNIALPALKMSNLSLQHLDIDWGMTRFDLTLFLWETLEVESADSGLTNLYSYNADLFDDATIERMAGHYRSLLEDVVRDPDKRISDLSLLTEPERHQLLIGAAGDRRDVSQDLRLHELFEAQVGRTPGEAAVIFKHQQLTYGQLNSRANQLAHYLRSLGVGPDVPVGICMGRSVEMVVGVLGVLKAGGGYVPLDPGLPVDRIRFILEDTQVPVLLTLGEAPQGYRGRVVDLSYDRAEIERESEENPVNHTAAENLAYVIYTSGSTGSPKGVMVQHNSVVNLAEALHERLYDSRGEGLGVSVNAPLIFDASVKQLVQLFYGHTIHVLPEEVRLDASELIDYARRHALDVLDTTPAMLRVLLSARSDAGGAPSPPVVLVGGEAIDEATWRFMAEDDGVTYFNVYGPTECTVDTAACRVQKSLSKPTIGRPLANIRVYILDKDLNPVPIGVHGEMHVGGACLARGYLGRADLTADRFIPDPFAGEPGARMYKSGDLARYLPDLNIEFLGRVDQQVKIRGFRIELGEVESVLGNHPDVREAVVMAREDSPGDKRLVAYVTSRRQAAAGVNELRAYLRERLPDYMVPSAFVALQALPINANGKVDYRALPAPDQSRSALEKTYVPPRTPAEKRLADVWAGVLGVDKIGIYDSFFELGGHSILAIQMMLKIRKSFDIDLPVTAMFHAPTIAEFARLMEEKGDISPLFSVLVPIQAGGTLPPLFCIHPTGGQVMVYQHIAAALGPDQPVYGLQSRALSDPRSEHESVDEMAAEYAAHIRRQQPEGPYHLMGWSFGGVIAVSVAGELERQGQAVAFVGLLDSYLYEEIGYTSDDDPLRGLGMAFGGVLAEAFIKMDAREREILIDELAKLPPKERLRRAVSWGQERNLLSPDLSPEVFEQQVNLTDAHGELIKNHQPRPIRTPIHVWWARERLQPGQPRTDWSRHTTDSVHAAVVEGNHFTIVRPPQCNVIAEGLKSRLRATGQERQETLLEHGA
ncbi:MAG: amino acid adenylation domain-containing protein [Blastocatellia bacterium]